jgi:putative ABC transport system substrate-binding protein
VPVVGFLGFGSASIPANRDRVDALRQGLRDLGYVEGVNIAIEFRWADNPAQLRQFAAEMVKLKVDVIFATSSTETAAALEATRSVPVVFATHADPVGVGHVASLPLPGGNATGLCVLQSDLTAKALEFLKEMVPGATSLGVLWSPTAPSYRPTLEAADAAAKKLGVQVHKVSVQSTDEFKSAFESMTTAGVGGVFVAASSLTVRSQPRLLAELALQHRLPTIFGSRDNVTVGGLMSYAPDQVDLTRRSAMYVHKILRGTKPAELPVEQASTFQLVINVKTAKALGISIPSSIVARVNEIID